MDENIQKAGANARAMGRRAIDNPYLQRQNMPISTGESIEIWQAKHDAWEFGWTVEDAMR